MAIAKQLRLLVIGSLLTAAIAKPVHSRLDDGDDDDTPLPLVIWHGKHAFLRPT
jgi:palmitoyl-protein thioesterase